MKSISSAQLGCNCCIAEGRSVRIIIIIIIKPRLARHMSVTKEDESQAYDLGLPEGP